MPGVTLTLPCHSPKALQRTLTHKFGGLEVSDAKRLRLMEEENRKLKKLVADQALDMMVGSQRGCTFFLL